MRQSELDYVSFSSNRRLVKFLVGLSVAAVVGLLCYMQFGPDQAAVPAHQPIAVGYDNVRLPDHQPRVFATDSRQQVAAKQVVLISVKNTDGSVTNGTGFLVDRGLVVTMTHLFAQSSGDELQVVCFDKRWPARVVFRQAGNDVVVARAPDCGGEKVAFATDEPAPGTRLTVVSMNVDLRSQKAYRFGHQMTALKKEPLAIPTGRPLTPHEKMVKTIADAGTSYILMDGLLREGNSGGPVLRPGGDVVGIASFVDRANSLSYAISASEIVYAIAQVNAR